MSDSSKGPKQGSIPTGSRRSMHNLQDEMAEAAGDAARNAADSVAEAVGAITVALGLKVARPVAEIAEDLGITIGDALSSLGFAHENADNLEVIPMENDFGKDSDQ